MTNQKVKYYPYTITGENADQAAEALDQEIANLDRIYEGIAPSSDGYYEAKAKIKKQFTVEIK